MEYGKIIAVTGLPGLFELISSKNDGAIVKSLEDQSTKFVSSRVHNFSHLESIEVFTVRDNVNLTEIFFAMEKEGGKIPDGKDGGELKKYFQKVYPDLDFERVYTSDLKKMAKWYEVLMKNKIEIKLTQQPEAEEEVAEEPAPAKAAAGEEEAPKKKAKAATAESKEVKKEKPASGKAAADEEETEEKPKKAAKKKAEPKGSADEEKAPAKKAPAKKAATSAKASEEKAPKKKS